MKLSKRKTRRYMVLRVLYLVKSLVVSMVFLIAAITSVLFAGAWIDGGLSFTESVAGVLGCIAVGVACVLVHPQYFTDLWQ